MEIKKDIKYVGVNDHEIDLFEGQYIVPEGMAYNSYVILDDEIAVMDSVDARFADEWLANIKGAIGVATPKYLVVQHVEPDHSGSIARFKEEYPDAVIVATAKAHVMIKNFFGKDFAPNVLTVGEGDELVLGKHELKFVTAPMVHWPEVMLTCDKTDKVLFSADAFGKFGALDCGEQDWACEARRYYAGIVGKYGTPVQALLKKLSGVKVDVICPLHGPVLSENLEYYIGLYNIWSTYGIEKSGVTVAYTSVYGNTKKAVLALVEELEKRGQEVELLDLARCDMAEAVESAFKYGKIVLATTTYNGDVFPFMREYIESLVERGLTNRKLAFIENGTWAPVATKVMKAMFEKCKNLTFAENEIKILSAMTEQNKREICELAEELCK